MKKLAVLLLLSSVSFGLQKESLEECMQKAKKDFQETIETIRQAAGLENGDSLSTLNPQKKETVELALQAAFLKAVIAYAKCKKIHATN